MGYPPDGGWKVSGYMKSLIMDHSFVLENATLLASTLNVSIVDFTKE
jgi:hypothetical protein